MITAMGFPLGWHTDLAVLRLSGSQISEEADHLVVRTPANPTYYWGNFILVTDPTGTDRPEQWLSVFEQTFPTSEHRAIGLLSEPSDPAAWLASWLFLERADVLAAKAPIVVSPLAEGYHVRELTSAKDWKQSTQLRQAAFPEQDEFERCTTKTRIAASRTGALTWFGAFAGDVLVSELGIADCGDGIARYQSVLTHQDHRRRGLTRHLLGVADQHARRRGAETVVIISDQDTEAGRLYRAAGLMPDSISYQVSRVPQPDESPAP
jgi:GNAT superfamily N-acetyltransferase